MKYKLLVLVVIVAVGFYSCKAKESKNAKVVEKVEVKVKTDYISQGLKKGVVVVNEKSDTCKCLIKLTDSNEVLEPFKELSKEFLDKAIVYVKFNRQRRMSRCENTVPVEIIEIKKERN